MHTGLEGAPSYYLTGDPSWAYYSCLLRIKDKGAAAKVTRAGDLSVSDPELALELAEWTHSPKTLQEVRAAVRYQPTAQEPWPDVLQRVRAYEEKRRRAKKTAEGKGKPKRQFGR